MKRSIFIIATLFLCIGSVFMLNAGVSISECGINLPDIYGIASGVSLAGMSFAAVVMPNETGYEDGEEHMGGNGVVAYIALFTDISTWPTENASPATLEETVLLTGNYVMATNKYFIKVLVPPNTLSDDSEGQGEAGGRSFRNNGVFKLPGKDAENRGLARRLNNARGVIIIPDEFGRIAYGSQTRPVQFMPSGSSGLAATDFKGFEYTWEGDSHAPGYTYNGSIPLSSGTIPPIS